jgi:hypothetical protein
MFFLNLNLPEFLALLGTFSGVVVALYLLDRARRKQTVATLRFFAPAASPPERAHRRHVQQPLSLVLQLLSIALLLLALAQLRCGTPDRAGRDHVLILDTSAWMASGATGARLIDRARVTAKAYLATVPPVDRVMVVRADALATPATGFTADREALKQAIDSSLPGASVVNVDQAISFAREAQKIASGRGGAGEIVFVGAARIDAESEAGASTLPPNLRVISVGGNEIENIGLRKVTARRSPSNPDDWNVFVSVENYAARERKASVTVFFDGAAAGSRALALKPGGEESVTFTGHTKSAAILDVRLSPRDAFPADNRAVLELPKPAQLPVTIYSNQPQTLKALFGAIPGIVTTFLPVSGYDPKKNGPLVVFDQFAPPHPPATNAIWIEPPAEGSPIPEAGRGEKVKLTLWSSDHPLGAGLHTKDVELERSILFRPGPRDIRVASSEAGPLIVAREGKTKTVVLGFQPAQSAMRYQLATPLLFANIVRWMAPNVFRRVELSAGPAGSVSARLDSAPDPSAVKVTDGEGRAVPFTVDGNDVRFFTASSGVARVVAGDQELVYSLTLPSAGDSVWNPRNVHKGLPPRAASQAAAQDFWQILALLGGAGLLADWLLFGVSWKRRRATSAVGSQPRPAFRKAS